MDNYIKIVFGIIGSIVSWLVGSLGFLFVVLLALMVIDYITGFMAGYINKQLSSRVGIKGLLKKTYVILLIACVYMVERAVLQSNGIVGDGIVIAYIVNEFLSITENGNKIGVSIGPLKNLIATLKAKKEDKDNNKGA